MSARLSVDGSGSTDPADPLTFTWTGPFGTASGPTPTVSLPLGVHSVTLTVNDGDGGTDSITAVVTITDTTPPTVIASLDLIGPGDDGDDDDEGHFVVNFSASDACDADPTVSAELVVQGLPDPIPVAAGQEFEFEFDDDGADVETEDGFLEIEAPGLTLRVTATDASGNVSVVEVPVASLAPDNDTEEELDD